MPKPPPSDKGAGEPTDPTLETGFEEVSPDDAARQDAQWSEASDTVTKPLGERELSGGDADDELPPPSRPPRRVSRAVQLGAIAAAVVAVAVTALVYRAHHRHEVLEKGLARARELIRLDTRAGYLAAAQVLEPLVPIDTLEAGSLRAFALAMLATDYREEQAGQAAEVLLVEPERATEVPPAANVARAVLAMGRREAGTAATYAARQGGGPWAAVVQGRLALLAGNPNGALEPLGEALAVDPKLPAALAVQGDAFRRTQNYEAARQAYLQALEGSPSHPRATYGLAKLALSGKAKPDEAIPPLRRLLADRDGTASNERARAALYLAALLGRAGDRAGAQRAMEASDLAGPDRAWLEKAVAEEELSRTGFRTVDGAPAALLSASDDDPYEPPPPPPPEPPKPPAKKAVAKKATKAKPAAKKTPAKSTKAKKSSSKQKAAKKKPPAN
ncbi:MAG TPA: tetratricopeptide repeat protein [Anaeromyxobacteraceae bacterium]|nr:tetratricopeptide repeat protein [Anaeromyxobacteraceae bacterium]